MSRMPLDKWTKREQLCLASAVSCSGDQNWINAVRTLKAVCGNGATADWYTQKNCALQYGYLLETVETTKRKKRSSESGAGVSSPATVEPPTELLLRRLTDERMLEIKAQMRRDQEEYSKVYREIEALQSDEITEQELQEMWQQIESQQETQRIDEMKLENRMREREQRKKEMASNWRSSVATRRSNSAADTTAVDMDVEEISTSGISIGKGQQQPAAPSPLLTSLLKSPTAAGSSNSSPSKGSASAGTGSVARATAPTITSLLTSGSSGIPNQPAITLKNSSDSIYITRPISGPAAIEVHTPTPPGTGRSPSQSAPTLSMLLEKNKTAASATAAAKSDEATASLQTAAGHEPDQAESTDASCNTNVANADGDETDPIEEQQLLEVFKNMDDIMDDIDIDVANVIDEDILKDVDDGVASPRANAKTDVIDFEDKLDALKREQSGSSHKDSTSPPEGGVDGATKPIEVVIGSSDDSNDNIPLAAVATQESMERKHSASNQDVETVALASEVAVEEIGELDALPNDQKTDEAMASTGGELTEPTKEHSQAASDDMIVDAIDRAVESMETDQKPTAVNIIEKAGVAETHKEDATKPETKTEDPVKQEPAMGTKTVELISMPDTDEESSSLTDSSKQDERNAKAKHQIRVSISASDEVKVPEQAAAISPQPPPSSAAIAIATALARPPLLRKLPHRDRSESPMIEDDTATASDHSTTRTSTRRRCSSTPLIDSIPNSPASSEHTDDRRETRGASKKMFLGIYSALLESKHAAPFRRPFHDEHQHRHAEFCLRPMDLPTIKRNIDSGIIRSISELQRDVLLMCHNVLLAYGPAMAQHKTARMFLQECQALKEFSAHGESVGGAGGGGGSHKPEKEKAGGNKARSGSRKSQRHH